jgi:hypothetical protein
MFQISYLGDIEVNWIAQNSKMEKNLFSLKNG